MTERYRIAFMGTPDAAVPILESFIENDRFEVVGVFTQPDRPKGRDQVLSVSPVKKIAIENGIPVFQPETFSIDASNHLRILRPDLAVVVAYGLLIDEDVLSIPKMGFINIHFSLLPYYRGAVPVQMAILRGDKTTGITVQKMAKKMDAGDILYQKAYKIGPNITSGEMIEYLSKESTKIVAEISYQYLSGEILARKQDESFATYCYRDDISKDKAQINWKDSAVVIHNKVRALNPWPIAWTSLNGKRVKIITTEVCESSEDAFGLPGGVILNETDLVIACGSGKLRIDRIQMEGKKETTGSDFLKGYKPTHFE